MPYEIGHALFKSLARAQITGQTVGMLKLLFHRETLEILGIHCFGANASEIIHIGQAIMSQQGSANSLLYFINTTFNYPTMAEAYRVAALNGYNRACRAVPNPAAVFMALRWRHSCNRLCGSPGTSPRLGGVSPCAVIDYSRLGSRGPCSRQCASSRSPTAAVARRPLLRAPRICFASRS